MHIPDGMISGGAALASGVVSLSAVGASLIAGARRLRERQIPLIGLVAAVLLIAQTIHVPFGPGINGHLIGGALAAILLGPWLACLVVAAALLLEMSVGHGGITTLGANILLNGLVAGIGSYWLFRVLVAVLPRTRRGFLTATAVTAWISVVATSAIASLLIAHASAFGALNLLPVVLIGLHALIGVIEAVVTTAAVGAVMTLRPDLMATRDLLPPVLTPSGAGT
jgi:cobalt/nickel transport system permease protein